MNSWPVLRICSRHICRRRILREGNRAAKTHWACQRHARPRESECWLLRLNTIVSTFHTENRTSLGPIMTVRPPIAGYQPFNGLEIGVRRASPGTTLGWFRIGSGLAPGWFRGWFRQGFGEPQCKAVKRRVTRNWWPYHIRTSPTSGGKATTSAFVGYNCGRKPASRAYP